MRINLVSKREAPISPYEGDMVCIPVPVIPFALGALWLRSQKYWWVEASEADGRYAMNEMAVAMLKGCSQDITDAINRVYMLIDRNENGAIYTYTTDPETQRPIINPPLPIVPQDPALYSEPGTKWQHDDFKALVASAISGIASEAYPSSRGANQILEDILAALSEASEEDQLAILQKILLALGGAL